MTRYLIVKTSALGDIVQAFPVIAYLKSKCPEATIDWVVEKRFSSLVASHPDVTNTICINSKDWRRRLWRWQTIKELTQCVHALRIAHYDALFDLQGNSKSGIISLFVKTKKRIGFGWKTAPERFNCCITTHKTNPPPGQNIRCDYLALAGAFFHDPHPSINEQVALRVSDTEREALAIWPRGAWMVCPGSQWENKRLSIETWQQFLDRLYAIYAPQFIFLSGSSLEREQALFFAQRYPRACVADRLSLPLLQHLMQKMALVIGVDSFAVHLAGTTAVPTFSIFGPSAQSKYAPLTSSCSYQGPCPYEQHFEKRCPVLRSCATGACMKNIAPESLYAAFHSWYTSAG